MPERNPVIEVSGLTKRYGPPGIGVLAVDHINFDVYAGEVFGFLGPNGAGKTTTIRILTGLLQPTAGNARVLGMDLLQKVTRIKKRIGLVPETSNLYGELSALDNLVFSMQLYGVPRNERVQRAETLLARFRLSDKRDTPFARLSRGMKRSLTIAAALAHRPALIFLDEPTTGLDVLSARKLRRAIADLRAEGVTVFLTTHYLEEAERLCDRIALIVDGHIVAVDTVEELKGQAQSATAVEIVLDGAVNGTETRRIMGKDVPSAIQKALAQAQAEGRQILALNTLRPTLEDTFVELTGLNADIMQMEKGGKGKQDAER